MDDDTVATESTGSETIGGYRRDYGSEAVCKNNWSLSSNVYLDLSFARVVIADAPSYESAAVVVPQALTSWASDRITFKVDLGQLASGSKAWIYIFDASNNLVGNGPHQQIAVP